MGVYIIIVYRTVYLAVKEYIYIMKEEFSVILNLTFLSNKSCHMAPNYTKLEKTSWTDSSIQDKK